MKKVYVAGPLNSSGNVAANIRQAFHIATLLVDKGFAPFVPHTTHFWDMVYPRSETFWMMLDFEFLLLCDAVFRIPGESKGADAEVEFAMRNGIPVYGTIDELIEEQGK